MPELPEVETIKKELEHALVGKKIIDVIVNNPKVIREPKKDDFVEGLKNVIIKNILRKGKLLILELSSGKSLSIHLKMTGQLILRRPLNISPERAQRVEGLVYPGNAKKSRISFKLSDGKLLDFNDQRLFAELRLVDDWHNLKFIQSLGPEPFDIKVEKFKAMLGAKKTKIKPLLMDQAFLCGIGNLYAAEVLFRAKIHPERSAASLSDRQKEVLFKEIKDTLREAIKHKGSSVDQYVQLSGNPGDYAKYHKVYDRQGKPCLICKTPIKRTSLGGRGTYFCPKCQK
ncbi:MAG: DNA-formamidopyrimidine glycosylase [Candidatus Omnitrophota bacterium]